MKRLLPFLLALLILLAVVSEGGALETFFVKRANITTTSATISFDFPALVVQVQAPSANTDEVCVDWVGGGAVCPAANTAGDDRIPAGSAITLDNFKSGAVSLIAASGTQTVFIRAWR